MAFCNACGATLDGGAKFCTKCGATQPTSPSASTSAVAAGTPGAPAKGSNTLKIILIVFAVLIGLGILGAGTMAFFVHRAIKSTHVRQDGDNVRVETPFGTVQSTTDPDEAASNLGVEIYPGAQVVKGTTSNMTMGKMHTAAADFETSDPAGTVADFYKKKFPGANIMSSNGDHYAIISTDKKNMLTINIEPRDGKTIIHIAKVAGKMVAGDESDN